MKASRVEQRVKRKAKRKEKKKSTVEGGGQLKLLV